MALLAIDTSLRACGVAVTVGPWALEAMARGQDARLVPLVGEVLAQAGLTYEGLTGVVVAVGPGSFTGTRVGLAAAQGLALALDIPVHGASTLDALGLGPDLTEDQKAALVEGRVAPPDPRAYLDLFAQGRATLPPQPLYLRPPGVTPPAKGRGR
ncbi:MAG TPA: tRNA (adenosine(37)-N6)-threonylcarbamoyltransferase complex dimerization subunit type 1 TsaB [Rhodospirillaceae bacterium]|nr:tRNA (adenosine(37)-N6)-threonylcarbamoyltransferase complex dimerization subunit type 1 TsaB [Alphaproteobacteria bacterium]HBH27062.1 tRNA (adenosine(37)-N6)-threonylcarbamoyltransferase complex dimerization subunit type 1 TsaB [Rhodospirillaceae bacterium]